MPKLEKWKMPPIAKVYEALSAVADGRLSLGDDNTAKVASSDGTKSYTVRWSKNRKVITSTDNASKFGHYIGYPIIAVLIELGDLPVDRAQLDPLRNVPWKSLNDRFKRDYDAAVAHVLKNAGTDVTALKAMAQEIYSKLEALELIRQQGGQLN